jgi:hypothetical protein
MKDMHSLIIAVAAAALGSACIVPPMRIGAGGGGAAGTIITYDQKHPVEHGAAFVGDVRAAVTPLALADHPPEAFDVGAGVDVDYLDARRGAQRHETMVAPFVEGVWFVHRSADHSARWRVGPTFLAEIPLRLREDSDRGVPFGFGAGVLAELTERVDGRMVFGGARGEWGIGVSLRGGVRHDAGDSYGVVLLSVEARVPGMAALPLPSPSL